MVSAHPRAGSAPTVTKAGELLLLEGEPLLGDLFPRLGDFGLRLLGVGGLRVSFHRGSWSGSVI